MTKSARRTRLPSGRCQWCGRAFERSAGRGRPRRYCRQGCRQQAFMARKLASAHGLGDDDVIVARPRVEELQGHIYCLAAALEDVERDLAGDPDASEVRQALDWLLENAAPFRSLWIEPRTLDA